MDTHLKLLGGVSLGGIPCLYSTGGPGDGSVLAAPGGLLAVAPPLLSGIHPSDVITPVHSREVVLNVQCSTAIPSHARGAERDANLALPEPTQPAKRGDASHSSSNCREPAVQAAPAPQIPQVKSQNPGSAGKPASGRHQRVSNAAKPAADKRHANRIAQHVEHAEWLRNVPPAPVYTPSAEEWRDPIAYIRSIQEEAARYGICVVKAPVAPAVPAGLVLGGKRFDTRQQYVRDADWGSDWTPGMEFWQNNKKYTVQEYQRMADDFAKRKLGMAAGLPTATVEAAYWKERGATGQPSIIEYGNDVEGTAFHPDDPLGSTAWNLNVSSSPKHPPLLNALTTAACQTFAFALSPCSSPFHYNQSW